MDNNQLSKLYLKTATKFVQYMLEVQVQSGDKIHATKHLSLVSKILRLAQEDTNRVLG
jgi:hypothetical protein